jgi:hypothetical protein
MPPSKIVDFVPAPVRIAADLGRRYPTAWRRFDEARSARPTGQSSAPTWLSHGEMIRAAELILKDSGQSKLTVEDVADLYAFGTWRTSQGVYRFDADLLDALRETPLEVSLPASLLTRLPEWAVYIETPGMQHVGRPIDGLIATLSDAPSGPSLMLTMIPKHLKSLSDLDRIQLYLTDMSLRERMARDIAGNSDLEEQLMDAMSAYDQSDGVVVPETNKHELSGRLAQSAREKAIDTFLSGVVPFISLLLYLCSEDPDLTERPIRPTGKLTKQGVRFFPPTQVLIWPVGTRVGAALRKATASYDEAKSVAGGRTVRPHFRKAHWHAFWSGPRDGLRRLHVRWLMPVAVNFRADAALPAVIHPVTE